MTGPSPDIIQFTADVVHFLSNTTFLSDAPPRWSRGKVKDAVDAVLRARNTEEQIRAMRQERVTRDGLLEHVIGHSREEA